MRCTLISVSGIMRVRQGRGFLIFSHEDVYNGIAYEWIYTENRIKLR
jgi:hypothetical protein